MEQTKQVKQSSYSLHDKSLNNHDLYIYVEGKEAGR
jgi:hypothetical protein